MSLKTITIAGDENLTQADDALTTDDGEAGATGGTSRGIRRQPAVRSALGSGRRQRSARPPSLGGPGQPPIVNQVQLISLPQLDLVQRSLKVLDVRVQRLHSFAAEEEKLRRDIEHVLMVISENHKALASVVLVLMSLQEEVRSLAVSVHRHQATNFVIQPPATQGLTPAAVVPQHGGGGIGNRKRSNDIRSEMASLGFALDGGKGSRKNSKTSQ